MADHKIHINTSSLHLSANSTVEQQYRQIVDQLAHDPQVSEAIKHEIDELRHQRQVVLEHRHNQEISAEVFLLLVIVFQIAICYGQRNFPKRFQEITFVFLFLYPLTLLYHRESMTYISFFFLTLWILWGLRTMYLMYLAMGPPFSKRRWKLQKDTPEKVYTWFLRTHRVCYYMAGTSLYLFFFLAGPAVLMLFIALYFGVLGRDCAEVCAERISSTIGYLSYETPVRFQFLA